MLDDEEFFDAVVASPTVGPPPKVPFYAVDRSTDDSTVESQGFRDPAPRRRDPERLAGLRRVAEPALHLVADGVVDRDNAARVGAVGEFDAAGSLPRQPRRDRRYQSRTREADAAVRYSAAPGHRGARGRHLPAEVHGVAAEQRAAVEIRHGLLQLPRDGRRGGGPPAARATASRPRRRVPAGFPGGAVGFRASASRRRGAPSSSKTPEDARAPAAAKIGAKVAPPSTTVDVDVETKRGVCCGCDFVVEAHVSSGFVGYENEVFGGLLIVRSAHLSQRE